MSRVILDTGPLVAWFCPRDEHHAWARRLFTQVPPGALVCEAVLTEVCHLVAKEGVPQARVIHSLMRGRVTAVPLSNELLLIGSLLTKYADAPMDFADACVVRLAEMNAQHEVCTVD